MDWRGMPSSTHIEDRRPQPSPFDMGLPTPGGPTPGGFMDKSPNLAQNPAPGYGGMPIPTNPSKIDIGQIMVGLGYQPNAGAIPAPPGAPPPPPGAPPTDIPGAPKLPPGPAPEPIKPIPPWEPGGPISPVPPASPSSLSSKPIEVAGSSSQPAKPEVQDAAKPPEQPKKEPLPSMPTAAPQKRSASPYASSLGMMASSSAPSPYLETVRPKFGFL